MNATHKRSASDLFTRTYGLIPRWIFLAAWIVLAAYVIAGIAQASAASRVPIGGEVGFAALCSNLAEGAFHSSILLAIAFTLRILERSLAARDAFGSE